MKEVKLTGESKDIVSDNIYKLKELFPEIVTEDKIDFDILKEILGENIDDSKERYSFTWPGKTQAIKESQKQSTGTLRPYKEESEHWDKTQNLYIEGDNLEVLKLLQKSYYNRVKCIYIDPPYNTGKDFIYSDNYQDNLENYLKLSGQLNFLEDSTNSHNTVKLSTNVETSGRFHTDWLNMMYPRLKLARNLLKDDGAIFISIDDKELENLKKICNEIFGEENFVGQWNWYKSQTPPNLSFKIKKNIEYILCYEKRRNNNKFKGLKKTSKSDDPLTKPQNTIKKLTFEPGTLNINIPDKTIKKGTYGTDKYPNILLNDLIVENNTNKNTVEFENKFIWVQDKLIEELEKGTRVNLSKSLVLSYKKSNYDNEVPTNFIDAETGNTTENAGKDLIKLFGFKVFDYPKPQKLISYLFNFLGDCNNEIFLDFFSGTATTAISVIENNIKNKSNNKFILVQIPEAIDEKTESYKNGYLTICDIGKERIKREGNQILEKQKDSNLDIGYKVFKLDSSNLEKWEPDFNNIQQSLIVDEIKKDRTNEDLVYEIMLKYGIDLTLPIEKHDNIYSIGYGALVICLDDHITKEITDKILEIVNDSSIARVVFKDSGFASDADKTNIKEILKTNHIDEFITI